MALEHQENPRESLKAESKPAHSRTAVAIAEWIHDHKRSTSDSLFGYTVYQYIRSAVASVPYGFSMAGTWLAFEKVAQASAHSPSLKYVNMFTASPLMRVGAMIGTSFSLYRATSKIGKWVNEYLFNPEDTLETTIRKVENLPEALAAKSREVYLPEAHSTLISALVLSAVVNYATIKSGSSPHLQEALAETKALLAQHGKFSTKAWGHFWDKAILNPQSGFIPQAAVNSLGYSLFFELGDRRFKDKQISRGMWEGDLHSIGSSSKSHPSLLRNPFPSSEQADSNEVATKPNAASEVHYGELPQGSRMGDTLSVLTSEPSALRFMLRRFIPTAIGITAYTALKFRAGKLFFGNFPSTPEKDINVIKEMNTLGGFLRNSWNEGAATSLFFMIPWVTDKYAPLHDRLVDNLEAAVSGRSYDAVVAGYQPKHLYANQQPSTTVAMPAAEEQRLASAAALEQRA